MRRTHNKVLWYFTTLLIAWLLWAATFDPYEGFHPTPELDVIGWRVGHRIGLAVDRTNQAIDEQNRGVKGAVNVRKKRVDGRVAEHGEEARP